MSMGTPFKFISSYDLGYVNVLIDKVPHIVVESSTDYLVPILTGLATLIGGTIPALIALRAIKANKQQMLQQQIIISKQNFIDNLRMKISIFSADVQRAYIYVGRQITDKNLTLSTAPEEVYEKVLELAHSLDLEFNYIELMIRDNENYSDVLKVMEGIIENFIPGPHKSVTYDFDLEMEKLTKEVIKCISNEWRNIITER